MKILAHEKEVPGVSDEQFTEEILGAEARKAWELYQSGVLVNCTSALTKTRQFWCWNESADEARRALSELPLVCAGLIDFQVIPLVAYPGFARLFGRKP